MKSKPHQQPTRMGIAEGRASSQVALFRANSPQSCWSSASIRVGLGVLGRQQPLSRSGKVEIRLAHNQKIAGATPASATNLQVSPRWDTSLPSCVEFGSTPTICSKQCVLHCAHHESNRSSTTFYLWVYCQPGRRPLSESGGRRFKSCHPDHSILIPNQGDAAQTARRGGL